MTTAMRIVLLVLVFAAVAAGIWFGSWLFATVTAPDEPPLSMLGSWLLRR
jgi:hypothetical protein